MLVSLTARERRACRSAAVCLVPSPRLPMTACQVTRDACTADAECLQAKEGHAGVVLLVVFHPLHLPMTASLITCVAC